MTKQTITTVEFHGATLLAAKGETPETTLVAMKPVVEGMGLDWSYQIKKLKDHPLLSQGVAVIAIPSDGGIQEATALPLNRLHFWMATIHTERLKDPAVRAKVLEYQTECADVLFSHFFGKAPKEMPESALQPMPHDEAWSAWLSLSTDERRTRQRDALIYGRAYGMPGMRYAMFQAGMPILPRYLMGVREQNELALALAVQASVVANVAVNSGSAA